jgi:hypothetical protein
MTALPASHGGALRGTFVRELNLRYNPEMSEIYRKEMVMRYAPCGELPLSG